MGFDMETEQVSCRSSIFVLLFKMKIVLLFFSDYHE